MNDPVDIRSRSVKQLLNKADWRPITLYDKETRPSVLLRGAAEHQWTLGYWGVLEAPWLYDDQRPAAPARDPKPFWRKAIDWDKGLPVGFDPVSFAEIDEVSVGLLPQD